MQLCSAREGKGRAGEFSVEIYKIGYTTEVLYAL